MVLICTNLMHRVADDVQAAIDIPLLHIADALADRARAEGWSRLGVLGTSWVMEEDFYVGRLARHGLTIEVPDAADRAEADRVIFDELTRGIVRDESRASYADILGRLRDQGAEAVVLGCTEIELLVRPEDAPLPLLPRCAPTPRPPSRRRSAKASLVRASSGPRPSRRACPWPWARPRSPSGRCPRRRGRSRRC